MTDILYRLFIKKADEMSKSRLHSAVGRLAGITGIVCNCLLSLLKLAIGMLAGSVAVTADGLNNLSDTASSVLTLLGSRLANRPADKDHPYGHARYEYLTALAVSVLVLVVGLELIKSSVEKIIHPVLPEISLPAIAALVLSMLLKLWMWGFYRKLGKKTGSGVLMANAVDSRNDVAASGAVLLGCVLNYFLGLNLDAYIGFAVAAFIVISGVKLAVSSVSPLLGMQNDTETVEKINSLVLSNDKVLGVHDLLLHDYGPGQCYASVHAEVSADESLLDCHELIDSIENCAFEELGVHLIIHCDPVENDRERNELLALAEEIAAELDPCFSVHDFRLARGAKHIRLIFDLSVPYSALEQSAGIKAAFDETMKQRGIHCKTTIRFDGKA